MLQSGNREYTDDKPGSFCQCEKNNIGRNSFVDKGKIDKASQFQVPAVRIKGFESIIRIEGKFREENLIVDFEPIRSQKREPLAAFGGKIQNFIKSFRLW